MGKTNNLFETLKIHDKYDDVNTCCVIKLISKEHEILNQYTCHNIELLII